VDPVSHAFKNRRVLAYVDCGVPDGLQVDTKGNVYSGTGDGVQVSHPHFKCFFTLTHLFPSRSGTVKERCWVNSSWVWYQPIWSSLEMAGLSSWLRPKFSWRTLLPRDLRWLLHDASRFITWIYRGSNVVKRDFRGLTMLVHFISFVYSYLDASHNVIMYYNSLWHRD
jgi:hypothetical protein